MARYLLAFALLAAVVAIAVAAPSAPVWAQKYTVHTTFDVPYWKTRVPIGVTMDKPAKKQFVNYYHGMDTYTYRFDLGKLYFVFPRIDTPTCQVSPISLSQDGYVEILPAIDSKWVYKGLHSNGQLEDWMWKDVKYNFTNEYHFYVNKVTRHPVRLHMRGFNFVLGSHPDEYVIHYENYRADHAEPTHFNVPPLCVGAVESATLRSRTKMMGVYLGLNMVAAANGVDPVFPVSYADSALHAKFHEFMRTHKKVYAHAEEYGRRLETFASNLQMIEAHNRRKDVTYKLGITQFTDMEYDEIQRVMNPNRFRRMRGEKPKDTQATRVHFPGTAALPAYINWVEKGVVNPPKDQGACGSCWTFGTAGSLEGAWAIKTGKLLSLSEQQILDCAWFDGGNSGCDGGFAGEAFTWIQSNKGISLEADYPYLMVDGYCKARIRDSGVRVTGHVNVSASELSLQDAVANHGPISVAINAATPDFYYMQGNGVYNNPACVGGIDDLDHEVLVVGYGTDHINGKAVDYWLLKNSWGVIWGDKGFWKMARNVKMNGGMCGLHQQGRYAIV